MDLVNIESSTAYLTNIMNCQLRAHILYVIEASGDVELIGSPCSVYKKS